MITMSVRECALALTGQGKEWRGMAIIGAPPGLKEPLRPPSHQKIALTRPHVFDEGSQHSARQKRKRDIS